MNVPVLSKINTQFILNLIQDEAIDCIVEYGSGASTLFFLEHLRKTDSNCCFISIETSKIWYKYNQKQIRKAFPNITESEKCSYWSQSDYKNFYSSPLSPWTKIVEGNSRYERWKRYMEVGPMWRFEKDSNSRLKNLLPQSFYSFIRPAVVRLISTMRNNKILCHQRREWRASITKKLEFKYCLVEPAMKDQFGESPNRDEYLNSGLNNIPYNANSILVMIDAGPRHYITEKVLTSSFANRKLNLCLFDAHRPEYIEILEKFNGAFNEGNSCLYDGKEFYRDAIPDEAVRREHLAKELWHAKTVN